jgi:hypothetical protein
MAYFGAKFLNITLGVVCYTAVCGFIMLLPYNFGVFSSNDIDTTQISGLDQSE